VLVDSVRVKDMRTVKFRGHTFVWCRNLACIKEDAARPDGFTVTHTWQPVDMSKADPPERPQLLPGVDDVEGVSPLGALLGPLAPVLAGLRSGLLQDPQGGAGAAAGGAGAAEPAARPSPFLCAGEAVAVPRNFSDFPLECREALAPLLGVALEQGRLAPSVEAALAAEPAAEGASRPFAPAALWATALPLRALPGSRAI